MSPRKLRPIIKIDEEKCDGCGWCVPSCQEGAIQIIEGKAKLVKESLCDGLGDCLGECPQGAITIEEREAEEFDEAEVARLLNSKEEKTGAATSKREPASPCTGYLQRNPEAEKAPSPSNDHEAALSNWPIQLDLIGEDAPFLESNRYVIAADCTAFSSPELYREILQGDPLLVGCPKLDDASTYLEKLTRIFSRHPVTQVTVVIMEVPCCGGFNRIVERAKENAGADLEIESVVLGIRGEVLRKELL